MRRSELKSFLGLVNYIREFMPKFEDIVHHLRAVDREGTFKWGFKQERAFLQAKQEIIRCTTTLGFFNLHDDIVLYTDASPFALGAVLTQETPDGKRKIISFASKCLTATETNYAQS